jgi:hypothetical protein
MIKKRDLEKELNKIDVVFKTSKEESEVFNFDNFSYVHIPQEKKAILGIDIYQYSKYEESKQKLIPFVFDLIIEKTINYLKVSEPSIFINFNINDNFISTGDGGFIIFPTPFHAFIFNLEIYSVLHLFNTGHFYPKLSKYIDGIIIRSAITYGNIYSYENNYYGKAIITNSRILSKDRLNRFLIDKDSYNFFISEFNGIESLSILRIKDLKRFLKITENFESNIFSEPLQNKIFNWCLRNIHIQKINDLSSKETILEVYNLEIQFLAGYMETDKGLNSATTFILTVGNSNLTGINE